ncbi:MAG: NAD(P)H-dependent oxidoreductase [Asticcacaulis sp.]|uniref:NAD(P)H-dependent oxidoreductase n=1 Tax=Asticcacaulis sp. TaxID=1872648 RepID=UPI003F7BE20D
MAQRILIINGNPARERVSFSEALVDSYREGAESKGRNVEILHLARLSFDPILHEGYHGEQASEPDIVAARDLIAWAEHIVFIYPMWQFNIPALLKGFCERVLTPGFAYSLDAKNPLDAALLKGRSARIIQTMGMPGVLYDTLFGAHGGKAFQSLLKFTGLAPVRASYLGLVEGGDEGRRRHLARVHALGRTAR